ncbi:Fibroblast growth factor receptor 1 [Holothuria leucospilota]|uniref:Fibroblast growth factor receptor 1 n=1 Tax=Holothuria leucospilota TaxID=206669 RepID=A0A9Q1BWG6_HOLLE|nr:Fibroblast growth factor receptor 1 [Holothuria leucospilota]
MKPRFLTENIVYESNLPESSKYLRWIGTLTLSNGKFEKVTVSNIKDYSKSSLRSLWKEYLDLILTLPDHSNLVTTLGYYTNNGYTYSVHEYASTGTLKSHLSSEYGNLSNTKSSIVQGAFLRFSNDIINGMEYLASKGCSHPGLQCKKVLLNVFQVSKLYDFCPSTAAVKVIEFYTEKREVKSVTTFAPENIFLGEHSPASDIWSLGLTLWEIYSGGECLPYLQVVLC